jgi:chromosome segregation ATPase
MGRHLGKIYYPAPVEACEDGDHVLVKTLEGLDIDLALLSSLNEVRTDVTAVQTDVDAVQTAVDNLLSEINDIRSVNVIHRDSVTLALAEVTAAAAAAASAQAAAEVATAQADAAAAAASATTEQIATAQADAAAAQSAAQAVQADVSAVQTAVAALQPDVDALKTDVAALQPDVDALKTDVAHHFAAANAEHAVFAAAIAEQADMMAQHFSAAADEHSVFSANIAAVQGTANAAAQAAAAAAEKIEGIIDNKGFPFSPKQLSQYESHFSRRLTTVKYVLDKLDDKEKHIFLKLKPVLSHLVANNPAQTANLQAIYADLGIAWTE